MSYHVNHSLIWDVGFLTNSQVLAVQSIDIYCLPTMSEVLGHSSKMHSYYVALRKDSAR